MKDQIEKQAIEEMAKDLCIPIMRFLPWVNCEMCESNGTDIELCLFHKYATILTKAGCRKQREGLWRVSGDMFKAYFCSECGYSVDHSHQKTQFCPECGAKMKGGAE